MPLPKPSGNFNPMDFITALFQAATLDEAFAAYEQVAQRLGFEGVLYTFVPQIYFEAHLSIAPLFKTSASYSPAFLKHYQEAGFEQDDFTVKKITHGETSVIDWWGESHKGELSLPERHVIITAKEDYGIRNGMTIPLIGAAGFGGISCISSETDRAYHLLVMTNLDTLIFCSHIFHEHIMAKPHLNYFFLASLLERLSVKEKRLLPFLITGLPMKTLPKHIPDISQKYGERLLENILKKFGGINKAQLIYYIGLLHLLNHL